MKILVVVPYFEEPHRWMISGQKTARELARNHQVVVLTTGRKASTVQEGKNLKIIRLKDIFLPDPINFSIVPGLFKEVRRIVHSENPDAFLINKHMFYTSLAIWPLKRLGKKVVVQTDTFPGINWFPKSKLVGLVMRVYARTIGNPILRAADKVVLLHEGLVADAKKLKLNYTVIHNGIDLERFDQTPPPTDLRKKKGDIWVGYVGRLESVKGWYDLAAAAIELAPLYPKLHFYFVGPKERAAEQIKAFEHPQTHFIGSRTDVAGLDKLFDIFVMPSLSEGLSNAIMEAMAAKCACMATNVGGNKILLSKAGLLFKPGDKASLKRALAKLLTDPRLRKKLGLKARYRVEEEFSLVRNCERLSLELSTKSPTSAN